MSCPHCKSSGRACAYCNPEPEATMSDETAPAPRRRHKPSDEEVQHAARVLGPSTPPENRPPRRILGRFVETLTCKLSPFEVGEKRAVVLQILDEIERLEEELASATKAAKGRIEKVKAKLNEARRVSQSGLEEREVDVVAELVDAEVFYHRADTGEIIRKRSATQAELQGELFG